MHRFPQGASRGVAVAVLGCALLALHAPASATARTTAFQGDASHAGFVRAPGVRPPLRRAWSRRFPGQVTRAVVADGRVIVTSEDPIARTRAVVALDARDGDLLWRFDNGLEGAGPPVLDRGRVYLEREYAGMLALSAATGEVLWEEEANADYDAVEPAAAAGVVYTVDGLGLRARRGSDGALLWMAETGLTGTPALEGGALFLAGSCSAQAFDRTDGRSLWVDNPVFCGGISPWGPVVHAGRVYGGVAPDSRHAVHNARNGARLRPMTFDAFPAFARTIGLFPDARIRSERVPFGRTIVARRLPSGRQRWRFRGDGYIDMPPLIVNEAVYVASASGRIYALDLRSGAVRWRARVARPPIAHRGAGLAAGDGLVVVPALGRLYAFRAA